MAFPFVQRDEFPVDVQRTPVLWFGSQALGDEPDIETPRQVKESCVGVSNAVPACLGPAGNVGKRIQAPANAVSTLQHGDGQPLLFQQQRRIEA